MSLHLRYRDLGRALAHFWDYVTVVRNTRCCRAKNGLICSINYANILTYLRIPITNAAAEGRNSKIQLIKYRARGYRNADRFERAIYFHLGGLDLSPTHTNA
jgi:transposase